MTNKTRNVLYIEDDPADVELVREAVRLAGQTDIEFSVLRDGQSAMDFVARKNEYSAMRSPDLVLLDLNLPGIYGMEILRSLRATNEFRETAVVVFSTSTIEGEIQEAIRLGATAYLPKPADFNGFKEVARRILSYIP